MAGGGDDGQGHEGVAVLVQLTYSQETPANGGPRRRKTKAGAGEQQDGVIKPQLRDRTAV